MRALLFSSAIGLVATVLFACSGGSTPTPAEGTPTLDGGEDGAPGTSPPGTTPGDGGTVPIGSGESPSGQLKIISLTSTVPTMTGGAALPTESASVTFVAIVTDTLGLDAIAGGQLMDEDGHTYAPFGAGANKGTFAASLSYTEMNKIAPADFLAPNTPRKFVARFFDNAGNIANAGFPIALVCRHPNRGLVGACEGQCVDRLNDGDRCGACAPCGPTQVCDQGVCRAIARIADRTECFVPFNVASTAKCAAVCNYAGDGGSDCKSRAITRYYPDLTCTPGTGNEYADCDESIRLTVQGAPAAVCDCE